MTDLRAALIEVAAEAWDLNIQMPDTGDGDPLSGLEDALLSLADVLRLTHTQPVEDFRAALATSDSEEALSGAVSDERTRLAAALHGADCTCPYSVEPADLAFADRLLGLGVRFPAEEALSGVARDLDVLRKAVDALETEVRWQLRGSAPGLDPMAGVKRRDLDERFATLRAVLAATEAPAAVAVPLDDIDPERLARALWRLRDSDTRVGVVVADVALATRTLAAIYRDAKP